MSNVMAIDSIGTYGKEDDIRIFQVCADCISLNFTSITGPDGKLDLTYPLTGTSLGNEFYYNLTGNNTQSLGGYTYCYVGTNGNQTASGCLNFEVTNNGEKVGLTNVALVGVFLLIAGLFYGLSFIFTKEKWMLKSFFIMMAIIMSILSVNTAKIIANESSNLSKMGDAGLTVVIVTLLIFILYVFVYAFKEVISIFKKKGDLKWGDEEAY